jgi:hypothetical protein
MPQGQSSERHEAMGAPQEPAGGSSEASSLQESLQPLLPPNEAERFWDRWQELQAGFVDNPRESLEQASGVVGEVMKRLTDSFGEEQRSLERQWTSGEDVTTEEMRVVLQHYRSFFERLLLTGKPGPGTSAGGVA